MALTDLRQALPVGVHPLRLQSGHPTHCGRSARREDWTLPPETSRREPPADTSRAALNARIKVLRQSRHAPRTAPNAAGGIHL